MFVEYDNLRKIQKELDKEIEIINATMKLMKKLPVDEQNESLYFLWKSQKKAARAIIKNIREFIVSEPHQNDQISLFDI